MCVTVVKTLEAVDQDRQGIRGIGFGQLVTARDAICTQRHNIISSRIKYYIGPNCICMLVCMLNIYFRSRSKVLVTMGLYMGLITGNHRENCSSKQQGKMCAVLLTHISSHGDASHS